MKPFQRETRGLHRFLPPLGREFATGDTNGYAARHTSYYATRRRPSSSQNALYHRQGTIVEKAVTKDGLIAERGRNLSRGNRLQAYHILHFTPSLIALLGNIDLNPSAVERNRLVVPNASVPKYPIGSTMELGVHSCVRIESDAAGAARGNIARRGDQFSLCSAKLLVQSARGPIRGVRDTGHHQIARVSAPQPQSAMKRASHEPR